MRFAPHVVLAVLAGLLFWPGIVLAQPDDELPVRISAFASGVGRYEPGQWGSLGIHASNTSNEDAEAMLTVYFGKQPQTQYARRLWLPAKSVRKAWLPVRIPSHIDINEKSVDIAMMSLRDSAQGEVIQHKKGFELVRTSSLTIDHESIKTAAILRKGLPDKYGNIPEVDQDAYELLTKARKIAEYSTVVRHLNDDLLPPHPIMWESLDQLVLGSDRIVEDSATLPVLRDWLHRGGRLLVLLDRVSPETVAAVIGNSLNFQVVDRVELDDFTIVGVAEDALDQGPEKRRLEEPVELVRVVTDTPRIAYMVNGWPAAFWERAGTGEVLFLALGPRGWVPPDVRPGEEQLPENQDPSFRSPACLQYLAARFFQPRATQVNATPAIEPILQEQIGYRIPGRALAATLLGINCVGLIAIGWWCNRRQRLDQLAWYLPALALTVALIFLVIGLVNSRRVPSMVSFVQLVQVFPETYEAAVSGLAAFYHQQSTPLSMTGGRGGLVEQSKEAGDATIRRIVWDDDGQGTWHNVSLPGGSIQFVNYRKPVRLTAPVHVTGRFGPQGLEGQIEGESFRGLQDVVIANPPAPSLAVKLGGDGRFAAGREDVLSAGQFIASRILSDDSRRRQEIYRQTVQVSDASRFPAAPTLLGWASRDPSGMDWPSNLQQDGSTLVAIPLKMQRTTPGQSFWIPATFLRPELAASELGRSTAYNPRTGEWITSASRATRVRLRFPLPVEVSPCQITAAELTVKATAPSRQLLVHSVVDNQEQLLDEIADPNRAYQITVDRPELLPKAPARDIAFTISISESDEELELKRQNESSARQSGTGDEAGKQTPTSFSTWQIDYVRVSVRGIAH